jgi:signal transduction histidine kinase
VAKKAAVENEANVTPWRDWTVILLRLGVVLFAALATAVPRMQTNTLSSNNSDIMTALVVGVVAVVIAALFLMIQPLKKAAPGAIVFGDWLLIGLFTSINQGSPVLLTAITGAVVVTSAMYVGPLWGTLQSVGALVTLVGVIVAPLGVGQLSVVLTTHSMVILILVMVAVVANVWSFVLTHDIATAQAELNSVHENRTAQLRDMRDRTRAIYEMAATLSGTLNYEKILNAAMNAGWIALRESERRHKEHLVSAVLLFRSKDNMLHVVTGRGLTRTDEGRVTPGEEGIISETIKQVIPIFGGPAKKDPELQYFVAFQDIRSVLCIPLRAGYDTFGVLLYGSDRPNAFSDDHTELLTAVGAQATIALQNAVLYQNLQDERDRIVEVEEEARKKLARDLHDGPTQSVAAIAMRMNIIYRMLERTPDDVPAELKKVEELARKTTKEIRHMLFTLRPLVLENQGLTAALEQLAEKMKETHNQAVAVRVARDAEKALNQHQQGVIFYIIEEAVGNARKHAAAELISVTVTKQDDVALVKIADNGVGFDTSAVEANYDQRGSLGMVNLRERSELLGGTLNIESAEGKGTTVTVVVPLQDRRVANNKNSSFYATGTNTKLAAAAMDRIRSSQDNDR